MNDTPARRKQVAFVDYITRRAVADGQEGQPGADQQLAEPLGQDRLGRGRDDEPATSSTPRRSALQGKGKKPIKVVTFPKDTDAAAALKTGHVDAYFGDSPVVAYYIAKDKLVRVRRLAGQPDPGRDRDRARATR